MSHVRRLAAAALLVASTAPGAAQAQPPRSEAVSPQAAATAAEAPAVAPTPVPTVSEEEMRARFAEQVRVMLVPGGLTADTVAARAVETAPSIRRVEAAERTARIGARRALLGVIPQVELTGRYTRLSDIDNPGLVDDSGFDLDATIARVDDLDARVLFAGLTSFEFPVILDQVALRASFTYPVSEVFLRVLPAHRAAQAGVDAQGLTLEAERAIVAHRAREAFYELARARGALDVATKAVEQAEAHRAQVAALVEAGAAARVDLMRVEANLASARVAVARTTAGVRVSEAAVHALVHDEERGPIDLGEDFSTPAAPAGELSALLVQAAANRQELRAMRALLRSSELTETAEGGARYPQLYLQTNLDYANPNQRYFPQTQEFNFSWDLSVVARWSLNETLDARQRVSEVRAQRAELEAQIAQLEDGVHLEVVQAFELFRAAELALEASWASLWAAEETRRVRFEQLQAGAAVTSDLIDADAELNRARLEVVDAAIEAHLSRARLSRAVGD